MADSDRFLPPRAGNAQQQQETLPRAAASRPYALAFANPDMSGGNGGRRNAGIPPFHPNVPPASPSSQLLNPFSRSGAAQQAQSPPQPTARGHSRSLSQPAGFFSLDSLPPLSPSPYRESGLPSPHPEPPPPPPMDIAMEEQALAPTPRVVASTPPATPSSISRSNSGRAAADGLPPRKAHRRSHSDIPFGFADNLAQILGQPPPLPPRPQGAGSADGASKQQGQPVKQEWDWDMDLVRGGNGGGEDRKVDGIDCTDDLIDAYMNFDVLDGLDSSEEKREDMDSRASGTKTSDANSSENESECSVNENASTLRKRSPNSMAENMDVGRMFAAGDFGNARSSRHCRSISMDSFMGKMDFSEDLLKLPPSPGFQPGQLSRNNSLDGNFSMEIGNGGFSGAEMKKIMANAKLAEIAMTDPKRAKRILANRQSAARSKERKMRYISELELKVQTLQTEATTLSAQLTILQRDSAGLTTQNNELKFRLQAMEQQAHLRDALHEALTQEVQRLRLATAQLGDGRSLKSPNPQLAVNTPPFHLHQQLLQSSQQQQQDQQQNRTVSSEAPSKSS